MKRALATLLLGGCHVLFPLTSDDGAPGDVMPGDRDGDGVDDLDDNCPDRENPDQHDEDGDGVGDVCDNCPHRANGGQENADGDHLGDQCDSSALFADCIVHFEPFETMVAIDSTMVGAWTVIGGSIIQSSMVANAYLRVDLAPSLNPWIVVGARVIGLGPTTDFSTHGVWFAEGDNFASPGVPLVGVQAQITDTLTLNPRSTAAIQLTDPPALPAEALLFPDTNLEVELVTEIELDLRGVGLSATGMIVDRAAQTVQRTGSFGSGHVALRTHNQQVGFNYVLVVERMLGGCPSR